VPAVCGTVGVICVVLLCAATSIAIFPAIDSIVVKAGPKLRKCGRESRMISISSEAKLFDFDLGCRLVFFDGGASGISVSIPSGMRDSPGCICPAGVAGMEDDVW